MDNKNSESFERLRAELIELAKHLSEQWSKFFQERLEESINVLNELEKHFRDVQAEIEERKYLRSTWIVVRDTKLSSQVIDNKPRNLVKKIIR